MSSNKDSSYAVFRCTAALKNDLFVTQSYVGRATELLSLYQERYGMDRRLSNWDNEPIKLIVFVLPV